MECENDRVEMVRALSMGWKASARGLEVDAIFENGSITSDAASGFQLSDRAPHVTITTCQARDMGLERGAGVTLIDPCGDRTEYTVRDPQHDGTGMSRIVLEAVR